MKKGWLKRMNYPLPQQCPVCRSQLVVRELHCDTCHTSLKGRFKTTRLAALNEEQLHFVETFIKVRGSMKEMERELSISYPTVRNRLEQIVEAMGFEKEELTRNVEQRRKEILGQLERGEISTMEAIEKLSSL
jgi:hypothetical protein